jgi:HSP20 family protein
MIIYKNTLKISPMASNNMSSNDFLGESSLISIINELKHVSGVCAGLPAADIVKVSPSQDILIRVELPGVAKENISIDVTGNYVTITAEKTKDSLVPVHSERSFGKLSRRFPVDRSYDVDNIKATLVNGVLSLTISKLADQKHSKIVIN